jgi:hypothetical protein
MTEQYKQLHPRDLKVGHVLWLGDYAWSTAIVTEIETREILGSKYWYIYIVRPHMDASEFETKQAFYVRFEQFVLVENDKCDIGRWPFVHKNTISNPRKI